MFRKTTGIGLAALTVAGSAIAVAPAAEAATCAVGRWRATSTVISESGGPNHNVLTGLEGVVLKISASGLLVYNYSGSKPLVWHGVTDYSEDPIAAVEVYHKILREQAVVSGGAQGTFTASPRTATGNATRTVTYTQPVHKVFHDSVVRDVQLGGYVAVPQAGSFTCSRSTLHLNERINDGLHPSTLVGDYLYRRF